MGERPGLIRILHLADLHLGWTPAFLGPRADARRAERDRLLERAVDFALDPGNGIGLVVIAGDLFESHRPDPALVAGAIRQLARLTAAGIAVVTVPGNHDEITYHDSVYRQRAADWPGILVQNPMPARVATLEVGGIPCHIYAMAYTGGVTRVERPLAEFPRGADPGVHVAVLHGALDWNAGERSLPIDAAGLARAAYHYVALGHIHQHQVRPVGAGRAVYPGAVEGKGWSDPGVGFLTVAEVGEGGVAVRRVPMDVRPIRVVDIDAGAFETAAELAAALAEGGDGRAIQQVRLRGAPPFPVDAAELEAALADRFYHLEVVDETDAAPPHVVERLAGEPTIRGEFVRRMLRAMEAAADERERRVLRQALRHGLAALRGGGGA